MAEPNIQNFHLDAAGEKAQGFSIAVRAGDILHIGGLVGGYDGTKVTAPNDPTAQTQDIYDTLRKVLEAHGATARNIVEETIFVTDVACFASIGPIRSKFYADAGAEFPSTVGVMTPGLAVSGLMVETRAVAFLGTTS